MTSAVVVLLILALCIGPALVSSLDNGVARTPPMGWNSWNHFHCSVSASVLKATVDRFVSLGLAKIGYEFINTDDCWSENARNSITRRIVPGKNFGGPSETGMRELSAYIESKGLKFGIYGAAGETTCKGRAGSLYFETVDAQTYVDLGAKYLKYDNCGQVNLQSYAKFSAMRDALNATGAAVVFSYEPHVTVPIGWLGYVGNAWRTGRDIGAHYNSMISELNIVNAWAMVTGAGQFGDADILEVGNDGLTLPEQRTHFALWAMIKSPLLIGCDLTKIPNESLAILKNTDLIAINQDPLGVQAVKVSASAGKESLNVSADVLQRLDDIYRLPARLRAFAPRLSNGLAWCDWKPTNISVSQFVKIDSNRIAQGTQCLTVLDAATGVVAFRPCAQNLRSNKDSDSDSQWWDVGNASLTLSKIRTKSGKCLGTDGNVLHLEDCLEEDTKCIQHRCFYSILQRQRWYHSHISGQLISSFTNHSIPPLFEAAELGDAGLINIPICLATAPAVLPDAPKPPPPIDQALSLQVWAGKLSKGCFAVALLNADSTGSEPITAHWSDLGLSPRVKMRAYDMYAGKTLGVFAGSITLAVAAHDVAAIHLSPLGGMEWQTFI